MTSISPVLLVGAGPGAPDLLTVRAARALEAAEVVFYDALVDARVLALASHALCIPVGKRAGGVSTDQRAIEAALIRAARGGRRVVRLKGGDPFLFGRGGEEAIALHAAGLPFEIVPGLSSALAGPAAINVPVTHRGLASGMVVMTAKPDRAWHDVVDNLPPGALTLVFMMALSSRAEIVTRLRSRGWADATPSAIVLGAHTPQAFSWTGSLVALPTIELPVGPPGLLVIGDVVSVADRLATPKEDHVATA